MSSAAMGVEPISEVCVIGGGPAGLAAAIAIGEIGCRTTVIDHAVPPIEKACGEGLMPDSVAALSRLGVTIPFDAGFRFQGIRFSDGQSSIAADFPNGPGIGVRRAILHDLLLQRAQELKVDCVWGVKQMHVNGPRVTVDGCTLRPDFIVGADGQNSLTRRRLGLHRIVREHNRYAYRRHYRIVPWSPYMELHWGPRCQIYITPVAPDEICVVSMAWSPKVRLDDALAHFPVLRERLADSEPISRERGALTTSRGLRRVCKDGVALIGDASGSVDAITGEGLCLSFNQALSLAAALRSGNLRDYETEHRLLSRRPQTMAALMLTLDRSRSLQKRALASLAVHPKLFASLLAVHVGGRSFADLFS
ncbi:MAG TPA: FAD-dependent monooxygenase, partial [Bryobacteraceae bacterium]|nr:FAD-dependent monooxygenase [Bryobacteraceae bacterium]